MEENNLSIEALCRVRKTRIRNSIGIVIALFALWLLADFATNSATTLPLWITILGSVIAPLGMFMLLQYDKPMSEYFNAHCPKCGKMIERSQFVGKAIPERCNNCGLPINVFNK